MMGSSIDIPPKPLPIAQSKELAPGLSILPPLSRKGSGPGIIILVPDSTAKLLIEDGIPSPSLKWAEEGYTVVEIRESALTADPRNLFGRAIQELAQSDTCEPKGSVGLVAYDPNLWNAAASTFESIGQLAATAVYATVADAVTLTSTSIPTVQHLAGKATSKLERTNNLIVYDYAGVTTSSFALPFQAHFDYSAEAVSHTRNLSFLKQHMHGPYFDLEAIWDDHTYFEFSDRSVEHTMSSMVQEPYVNHIPTLTGGIGRERLSKFYRDHFIWTNPADTEFELISRTVGIDRVIDEFVYKFTHDSEVDWLIPGIPPTGRKLEIPFTAVVNIRGDRLYHEHIAWDQATVLVQLGLMPEYLPFPYALPGGKRPAAGKKFEFQVPAAGRETAMKMRDKNAVPSNELFHFRIREV